MPQRDYILRLIEQVAQLLARVVQQREMRAPAEALQSIMAACERLFAMEAVQLFQFTPDQHLLMLAEGETDEMARNKILMYARLTAEAGKCYEQLNQPRLAQLSFLNALRLTLKAQLTYPLPTWPEFAPNRADLLAKLGSTPLDEDTTQLLAAAGAP